MAGFLKIVTAFTLLVSLFGDSLVFKVITYANVLSSQSLYGSNYHGYSPASPYTSAVDYGYPANAQELALSKALYSQAKDYSGQSVQGINSDESLYSYTDPAAGENDLYSAQEHAVLSSLQSLLTNDLDLSAKAGMMYPYHQQQYQPHPMMMMYGHMDPYGFKMEKKKDKKKKDKYHEMDKYHDDDDGYHDDDDGYHDDDHHEYKPKKKKKKKKIKKVYVPIVIKKKKKKKRKTISTYKGFYIPGGSQIFGKFKKKKDCQKACEIIPTCFAADYNPWLKKCYIHTNITACEDMRTHPKLIHFKKVPCENVETPRCLVTLGTKINGGLEQKGIKNLQDCIKKCATAGQGIAPTNSEEDLMRQICFGVDYDFATHKCYFHTNSDLCPDVEMIPTPAELVEMPSVVNILLCPFMIAG